MRIRKNGKVVNLTESDLRRIVKRVLKEQTIYQTNTCLEHYHSEEPPKKGDTTHTLDGIGKVYVKRVCVGETGKPKFWWSETEKWVDEEEYRELHSNWLRKHKFKNPGDMGFGVFG
jgi:hypothetical protein